MERPAGDLETLGTPEDRAVAVHRARTLSARARVGLVIGATIFTAGALIQILATLWVATLTLVICGVAEALVHSGGLDLKTFGPCSIAAILIDAALLGSVGVASVRQHIRRMQLDPPPRFWQRHPLLTIAVELMCALAIVLVLSWSPSPYFPYPLTTAVVLANAYFFALIGVFVSARLADRAWRRVRRWGVTSEWRAGFLTASLVLLGLAGGWSLETAWYRTPIQTLRAQLELDDPGQLVEHGALATERDGLCLAANALEPLLAQSSRAPACAFLDSPTNHQDLCFTSLMTDVVPSIKQRPPIRGLNTYDLDDSIMKALIATCAREPLPLEPAAYFRTVVRNHMLRIAREARRMVSCDDPGIEVVAYEANDPQLQERKLLTLWERSLCTLDPTTADIVRRRLESDESFREIGDHLQITEARAKDTFHNAIKRLRKQLPTDDLEGS
ncbi:MAG TPA: sigma-70 family RNA polymerase sigma factor [Kofleriaceae bacterium]|jgi:DNA-directed RNA polymerase specialized sigma24 family protein|nr:sigma-70 family RNA polymerase sigma factor [Kofleriaceae bacterium]